MASRPGALALEGRGGAGAEERVGGFEDALEAPELSSLEMTEGRRRRTISPVDGVEAEVPGAEFSCDGGEGEGTPPCSKLVGDMMRHCRPILLMLYECIWK